MIPLHDDNPTTLRPVVTMDSGAVIALGDRVAWDDAEKRIVLPGAGLYPVGIATLAAGDSAATVTVRLDGIATVTA